MKRDLFSLKRLLDYSFIVDAVLVSVAGCLSCFASFIASTSDPMGISLFFEIGKMCAFVTAAFACLAIYTLKSGVKANKGDSRVA